VSIDSTTHVVRGSLNAFCANGWEKNWELMEYSTSSSVVHQPLALNILRLPHSTCVVESMLTDSACTTSHSQMSFDRRSLTEYLYNSLSSRLDPREALSVDAWRTWPSAGVQNSSDV
jgi:hypothetical protein